MSKPSEPYLRFYYDKFQREYPEVYDDDRLYACWSRLLVAAEKAWPVLPEVPRSTKRSALARLVEIGLVLLVHPHRFRIRGHEAERARRAESARKSAAVRWQSERNANAMQERERGQGLEREGEHDGRPLDGAPTLSLVDPLGETA